MWRAEGADCDRGGNVGNEGVELGEFENLIVGGRWQEIWYGTREHAFAGAGRAEKEDIVVAGDGDCESAFGLRLAGDLVEKWAI